jgi:hypothetical protein
MEKETYRIIKSDFKPIKGLILYYKRTSEDPNHFNEDYQAKSALITVGLFFYNTTIIGAPILGLAKLLLK